MKFDKDEIKRSLTIEQVFNLVAALGGNPSMSDDGSSFIARTICHDGDSHKLYYYANSQLFQCFTNCGYFDVFGLVQKIKNVDLFTAMRDIVSYFGLSCEAKNSFENEGRLEDWDILEKYLNHSSIQNNTQKAELKIFPAETLKFFPQPHILDWEKEDISHEVIISAGIHYNPINQSILIPHYNAKGDLIGIRERTLIKEEEIYGKYRPAIINGQMYNHPLSLNLYNLNKSKDNIAKYGYAFVFEGEKGPLKYASYFGQDSDCSVATCGSSFSNYQFEQLLDYGAKEIIIAYDKQFQTEGDDEYKLWTKKLMNIHNKFSSRCKISFLFDKQNLLGYKESPIDRDIDTFLTLYKERIII